MTDTYSFGEWLKQRRKALKLTQRELAGLAFCSPAMVKKIEADERQPSPDLAQSLADALQIPEEQQDIFIDIARGERPVDTLLVSPGQGSAAPSLTTNMPSGSVTFLLTDIEGSTRLWDSQPEQMKDALAQHDAILREAIEAHNGFAIKTTGDGWHAVFQSAPDAVWAAVAAQQTLLSQTSLKVRMALHTGTAEQRDGDYFGTALSRVARVMSAGHGGQILLTGATAVLVRNHLPEDMTLTSLGHHRLKDLARMEEVFQLTAANLPAQFPPLRTEPTSTLPQPATPFVGRAQELAAVTAQLEKQAVRLVTLLGPGGMGKTRLAIEVARSVQHLFSDGAVFVPLAAVNDPELIPQAIFQAMQIPLAGNDPPLVQAKRIFQRRHTLLVLDNFEQLTTAGAAMLSELLGAAQKLTLLVTSRERLNLAEEWLFPLPELDEAAALFGQSAVRVKPGFDVDAEETAVNHICTLVGRHPLAVELAASWTRFMSCDQIAAQIQQDLDFLSNAPRNAPERHQSLRAVFDHSWALLTTAEQDALAKLSVFRSGFAPEQAAEAAGAGWPVLLGLVDKSLVETRGDGRFDLHEFTRQYAADKLVESGQKSQAQKAHFDAFWSLSRSFFQWFNGPKADETVRRTEQEHDNFRTALRWGLQNNAGKAALNLTQNLFIYWLRGGFWNEAERWIKQALALVPEEDTVDRCTSLASLGTMLALQGHFAEATPYTTEAYFMARRLEEPWPLVITLQIRGQAIQDKEKSMAAFNEAIAICQDHPDDIHFQAFLGSLYGLRGDKMVRFGMIDQARASYEASLAKLEAIGDTAWIAYPRGNLGRLALQNGDLEEAQNHIRQAVAQMRQNGNRVGVADWIYRLGQVQLFKGELDQAEQNLQETLRLYDEVGNRFGPPGVISNLALVAAERGKVETAVSRIQDSFTRFIKLSQSVQKVNLDSDFYGFGDSIDSLLHAGLVAHAQGDWHKALTFFINFDSNKGDYEAIRPLQDKVEAAKADIAEKLSPSAYETAVHEGQTLKLDEILTSWIM